MSLWSSGNGFPHFVAFITAQGFVSDQPSAPLTPWLNENALESTWATRECHVNHMAQLSSLTLLSKKICSQLGDVLCTQTRIFRQFCPQFELSSSDRGWIPLNWEIPCCILI